ncbi:MAG: hypothetical protein IJP28_00350 [Erysipelotrichales bacterium]|nr:hypothetical protein [Erysipelotrichales bacterium]MBR3693692.1 hypothetical protein [Erysipelotrichales bacterium]
MMKRYMMVLLACSLVGCSLFQQTEQKIEKVGVATSDEEMPIVVEVTLVNDVITKIDIDEKNARSFDGMITGSKKELGDQYNMRAYSSIGKEWYEQITSLETYIEEKGIDAVMVDEDGYVLNDDLKMECTIEVDEYLEVSYEAIENATE